MGYVPISTCSRMGRMADMAEPKPVVRERTKEILMRLTEEERRVMSEVLKVEREYLHQKKPRGIREDVLKAVRDIVKGTSA